jgi:hypothetical protein
MHNGRGEVPNLKGDAHCPGKLLCDEGHEEKARAAGCDHYVSRCIDLLFL